MMKRFFTRGVRVWKTAHGLLASSMLMAGMVAAGAAPSKPPEVFKPSGTNNSLRIEWTFGAPRRFEVRVFTEHGPEPFPIRMQFGNQNLRDYIDYSTEAFRRRADPSFRGPERTPLTNTCLKVDYPVMKQGFSYDLIPPFHDGRGLYEKAEILARMDEWKKGVWNIAERKFVWAFRFVPKRDEVELYLDGQYAGRIKGSGRLVKVEVWAGTEAHVTGTGFQSVDSMFVELPALGPGRAHPWLRAEARLSIAPGDKTIAGIPFQVFPPEQSLDTGRHRQTTHRRDLGWDPMMCRHAFGTGPEYFQFCVPSAKYLTAYVLCADVPQTNRVPVLGTHLTRYGNLSSGQIAFDRDDLSAGALATNRTVRKVGTLTYRRADGKQVVTPLWLVKHRLDFGKIIDLIDDKAAYGKGGTNRVNRMLRAVDDYLDFEFVGAGTWDGFPRSSIQIFGCTLAPAPYSFRIVPAQRGNIFADNEEPVTFVEITAAHDGVKGTVAYEIYDPYFKPLQHVEVPFTIGKGGSTRRFSVPLRMPRLGWYGLNYEFKDEEGNVIARHEAAFALLGPDTREAGFESPYAAWPHGGGAHGNNPNRTEVAELMHKAGYHTTWTGDFPFESEAEFPDFHFTSSMFHIGNPGAKTTADDVRKRLDAQVAAFRAYQRRFPHCQMLQLLHEQGGRDLAPEMTFTPAVRGEYKGIDGSWIVYWCTEAAKRFKKEFPEMPIMIGNGSSSSEMIALLCRNGFDLNLIDYLGIESKGFGTMPELDRNREAPGMLWALHETGRRFGFDKPVSACNEYVFRPERRVGPHDVWPVGKDHMWVTEYTVRDYLLSLAHGCKCISTGHLEDSKGTYYDTNWGAGGQCKSYPDSYPKRMFVALATFTKVFDKATFSRRLETDGNSTYALEFRRDRRTKDFASAFWTPRYGVDAKVYFPAGTRVTRVELFGEPHEEALDPSGAVRLSFSGTPAYLVSSRPVTRVQVLRHFQTDIMGAVRPVRRWTASSFLPEFSYEGKGGQGDAVRGVFALRAGHDATVGDYAEFALDAHPVKPAMLWLGGDKWAPLTNIPEVVKEYAIFKLKEPVTLEVRTGVEYGLWIKGNSSFASGFLQISSGDSKQPLQSLPLSPLAFEGWHLVRFRPVFLFHNHPVEGIRTFQINAVGVGSARQELDPLEMRPILKHPGFGGIVEIDMGKGSVGGDDYWNSIMKHVNDKDL